MVRPSRFAEVVARVDGLGVLVLTGDAEPVLRRGGDWAVYRLRTETGREGCLGAKFAVEAGKQSAELVTVCYFAELRTEGVDVRLWDV